MHKYVIKRLLMMIPVLVCVAFVIYAIMNVAEGDPVYSVVSADATEAQIEAAREELGLNGTLLERYFRYVKGMLTGDLGTSYVSKRDVMQTYLERLPNTLKLASVTMVVALAISIPLGIIAAVRRGKLADGFSMVFATIGVSVPSFVICVLMMYLFCEKWKIFPSYGLKSWKGYILPVFCMAFSQIAYITRLMRSSMLETLRQDYIRTARAKGVPGFKVIFGHALKNSLIPVITYFGPMLAYIVTGSIVVEQIFAVPGIGRAFVNSITGRDYPLIMGTTIILACLIIIMNLVSDLLYKIVDPRIELD